MNTGSVVARLHLNVMDKRTRDMSHSAHLGLATASADEQHHGTRHQEDREPQLSLRECGDSERHHCILNCRYGRGNGRGRELGEWRKKLRKPNSANSIEIAISGIAAVSRMVHAARRGFIDLDNRDNDQDNSEKWPKK
jgi:hypothetical protein